MESCTEFNEEDQLFSMTVDASEDQFGHSEVENEVSLGPVGSQGNESVSKPYEYDSDEESVKILPLTQEQRQQQINEIDQEMVVKLSELRDIMTAGGLSQSS